MCVAYVAHTVLGPDSVATVTNFELPAAALGLYDDDDFPRKFPMKFPMPLVLSSFRFCFFFFLGERILFNPVGRCSRT